MYRIIDAKDSKKTMRLMEAAVENNAVFVCSDVRAMANKALRYGICGLKLVDYLDFVESPDKNYKYYIDELESFVEFLANYQSVPGCRCEMLGYDISLED